MAKTTEELTAYMTEMVARARKAQKEFELSHLYEEDQHDVDAVVRAFGMACMDKGAELAAAAVAETGMGDVESKVAKIVGTAIVLWNCIKGKKSIGVLDDGVQFKNVKIIAKPLGVIGACMPSTNPIATIIHNGMSAIKSRNAIIVAPHPASAKISNEFVEIIREAIVKAGAPADLIQCIGVEEASIECTGIMLRMCDVNVGTGGPGMVKAVYSSGKPGFGVGPGNAQSIIDEEAPDLGTICGTIIYNRSSDQGIPCVGEQCVHVPAAKEAEFIVTMQACGAFLIEGEETIQKLREVCFPDGKNINRKVVGRMPSVVGKMIGIEVPEATKVLMVKVTGTGAEDVLCKEMLFPIVRYRPYTTFEDGFAALMANLENEGAGHSSAMWSLNDEHITYAANRVPVGRFHINQMSSGQLNGLPITLTLGCGSWGGNSMSENLSYTHLMNKTHLTYPVENPHLPDPADWDVWE